MTDQVVAGETKELPFTLREKLEKLAQDLHAQNPGYVSALNEIQGITLKNPEYVYMLSDEQIRTIVQGYEKYRNLVIDPGKVSKKQAMLLDEDSV